jgi:hypothetical protein
MNSKCALILYLTLFKSICFGHDQNVHQAITGNAFRAAYKESAGFASFLNVISSDATLFNDASNNLVIGSNDEDFADFDDSRDRDVGGKRSLNHFYDPLDLIYGKSLSDFPTDWRVAQLGRDSFSWASVSNCPGTNIFASDPTGWLRNKDTTNIWSWQNARYYEWVGLTATNLINRQTNQDNMFRAVGQVMHLLEDTSQPQHVRNEQHLNALGTLFWESPIEDYGSLNVTNLNYGNASLLDWRLSGFTKLEDFWNRGFYEANGDQALIDDAAGTDPTKTLGLAEWCNGNFVGDRHKFGDYYHKKTSDIRYYPYPQRGSSTDFNQMLRNHTSGLGTLSFRNGDHGQGIYINKTGDGVKYSDISRFTYFGTKFPNAFGSWSTTIRDDNVLSNYHNVLIPRAVNYSAGLIDYYFRGVMEVGASLDSSSSSCTITISNSCSQDFYGGSFSLLQDDTNGIRTQIQQYPLTGVLSSGGTTNVTFDEQITQNTKFTLVYQGTIGFSNGFALDPVDENIGIAAKSFTLAPSPPPSPPCLDCGGCQLLNLSGITWYTHAIAGDIAQPATWSGDLAGSGTSYSGSVSPGTYVTLMVEVPYNYYTCSPYKLTLTGDRNAYIQVNGGGGLPVFAQPADYEDDNMISPKLFIYATGGFTIEISQ